jgi:hypothetical protein
MNPNPSQFIIAFLSGHWIPPHGSVGAELMNDLAAHCPAHRTRLLKRLHRVGLRRFGLWWPFTLASSEAQLSGHDLAYLRDAWGELVDTLGG